MPHKPQTDVIHGRRDKAYRSGVFPIYQTSTFAVESTDDYGREDDDFFAYSRLHNPTTRNAEEKLAKLEHAENALLFSSGMAAITSAIMAFVQAGDTIAVANQIYGTTLRFVRDFAPRMDINVRFLSEDQLLDLKAHAPEAKLLYFETPINPHTNCVDIAQIAQSAKEAGAISMIDSTFASPVNQNPIDYGVDVVLHSATKYIGGHSDVLAGVAMGSYAHLDGIHTNRTIFGGMISPNDAFLIDRSLKTINMRVNQHNTNAQALAEFFAAESKVKRAYYPGLSDSPGHTIARQQMHGYGGMLCIDAGSIEAAKTFCDNLQLSLNAPSLGSVETLVSIPVLTSHADLNEAQLEKAQVTTGMVRISVGLEDVTDLIEDFKQALARI